MNASRPSADVPRSNPNQKVCSRCRSTKPVEAFCRRRGNNLQHEHATCNQCSERTKNKRDEEYAALRKRNKFENDQDTPPVYESISMSRSSSAPSNTIMSRSNSILSSISVSSISENLGMSFGESHIQDEQLSDNVETDATTYNMENSCYDNDAGGLLYSLDEVQELVAQTFQEAESSKVPVTMAFEIEWCPNLLEIDSTNQEKFVSEGFDPEEIKTSFHQVANTIRLPIEAGSGYYWEVRKVYISTRKKKATGCATVYLACTVRTDRQCRRPEDQPVQRISEARAPIDRFDCIDYIKLTIDLYQQYILVQGKHQEAHPHPEYRQAEFPVKARQWIQENISYNLRNVELYRRLCDYGNIDSRIHTKEQVAYWAYVYSKKTYVMNHENQLSSAKAYLEKPELIAQGYKVVCHVDNDFVRALGFITPLFQDIRAANVTEIVIDSTFKTNQERFELFAVNANCGGYGMPLAYLFLSTSDGTEAAFQDPSNEIKTRVGVLLKFFTGLRQEGLQPAFVLLDKDAGEIAAVSEAWSWRANIQLCYWHLEHAIERRLKDRKLKQSTYSESKASEAHQKFEFIDPSWIPHGRTASFCTDAAAKEVAELVKKHANMHPLIPVAKNTFLSFREIYRLSVQEAYDFCYSRNLVHLWGYLWINWYNEKDWKLFARSSYYAAMPLARTTMITESHWRVLKYNYKYNYNRPRLDGLTHILVEKLLPDFKSKHVQYNGKRSFPSWWQAFKKDWRMAARREIQPGMEERHHIDENNWVCSCGAFLRSRYLICKHLVHKKDGKHFIPTFSQTRRRHDYPFLTFGPGQMPAIMSSHDPWSRIMGEHDLADVVEENPAENI